MFRLRTLLLSSSLLAASLTPALAEAPRIVASIKPIHSLVAAVTQGVTDPALIIEGAGSPHTYSLKPSQAAQLQEADMVFWVGHELETFLEQPIETIAASATSVELIDAPGLETLAPREGGRFEKHSHGDDGHDHDHDHDQDEHAHADDGHDHDHDDHAHDDHAHDHDDKPGEDHAHEAQGHDEHAHDHGSVDAHIWLDPENAKAMVRAIEAALVARDPDNAARYTENAEAQIAKLDALIAEVRDVVAPVRDKGYIVFHDAYRYFERRFGTAAVGGITISPEVRPGAARLAEIRDTIRELDATCVFSEPQFEPAVVSVVIEGTQARTGVLDPLGAGIDAGPDHYAQTVRAMAGSLRDCLAGES
ncbi:metal ABC transporter solute-binding protein, Zn/Mn family [Stappia sp.]|uniref:zinc ABC transporter substrate-binding protein n=1 Tax=Stappia sp. TaxID=1870903 RepID=UPI0032D97E1F